jgi:4-hydroxy-4-methyl-2-oxoglutarate aldolase
MTGVAGVTGAAGVASAAGVVYARNRRVDPAIVERARNCWVSDLHEAFDPVAARMATMSERMRPLALGIRMAGVAVTVRPAPGDNLFLHRALKSAGPDDVLVVAANGEPGAQWGYLAALVAQHAGLAGVVVHGTIRDVDQLAQMRYPVWSTAISAAHPEKVGAGMLNVPVVCDGVLVRPGDLVVGDGDGVIVVPRERALEAVEFCEKRAVAEKEAAERIAAGATLWDLHDLGDAYRRLGVIEHPTDWDGHS